MNIKEIVKNSACALLVFAFARVIGVEFDIALVMMLITASTLGLSTMLDMVRAAIEELKEKKDASE